MNVNSGIQQLQQQQQREDKHIELEMESVMAENN